MTNHRNTTGGRISGEFLFEFEPSLRDKSYTFPETVFEFSRGFYDSNLADVLVEAEQKKGLEKAQVF